MFLFVQRENPQVVSWKNEFMFPRIDGGCGFGECGAVNRHVPRMGAQNRVQRWLEKAVREARPFRVIRESHNRVIPQKRESLVYEVFRGCHLSSPSSDR